MRDHLSEGHAVTWAIGIEAIELRRGPIETETCLPGVPVLPAGTLSLVSRGTNARHEPIAILMAGEHVLVKFHPFVAVPVLMRHRPIAGRGLRLYGVRSALDPRAKFLRHGHEGNREIGRLIYRSCPMDAIRPHLSALALKVVYPGEFAIAQ